MPLERNINIAINGPFWVDIEVVNPEHPFTAMMISRSKGTCLISEVLTLLPDSTPEWEKQFSNYACVFPMARD